MNEWKWMKTKENRNRDTCFMLINWISLFKSNKNGWIECPLSQSKVVMGSVYDKCF